MPDEEKLNACKCGKMPTIYRRQYGFKDSDTDYRISCVCGFQQDWIDDETTAIKVWNRRSHE